MCEVIQFKRPEPPKQPSPRCRGQSQYDLYKLPFFNEKRRLTWAASPKRRSWKHYGDDCKLGGDYAIAFLKWCDGTSGWASLLGQMMTDMIGAGPAWKVERR